MVKYEMPVELDELTDKALSLYARKKRIPKERALSLLVQRGVGTLITEGWTIAAEILIEKEAVFSELVEWIENAMGDCRDDIKGRELLKRAKGEVNE